MNKIFQSFINDDFDLDPDMSHFIENNPEEAIKLLDDQFDELKLFYTPYDVAAIFELAGQILDRKVRDRLLENAFHFYIDHVSEMILKEEYFLIFTLMDLFINQQELFETAVEDNILFLNRTYPILFIDSPEPEEYSSFIFIAGYRFVNLIKERDNWFDGLLRGLLDDFKSKRMDKYLVMTHNW